MRFRPDDGPGHPALTDEEREHVKSVARRLLEHVHEKLVADWRRKAETLADVRVAIRDVLDELPERPYPRPVYDAKVQAVFDHVRTAYRDDGSSAYDVADVRFAAPAVVPVDELTEAVVIRIRRDPHFARLVASRLDDEPPAPAQIDR